MLEFDMKVMEQILISLEEQQELFPQFVLTKQNNELLLLGKGGFSSVFEMYNKARPDSTFALKVTGFQKHTVTSEEFQATSNIQWILGQESKYIMRILTTKELLVFLDEDGSIKEIKKVSKESWEEESECLHLQFILMEKLDELLEKDRFGNVKLRREELCQQSEVLKFALEIGQALNISHNNNCMHRDIKIENIFWDEKNHVYKLGDFGIAKHTEDGVAKTVVYTDGYAAPEIERRLFDAYDITADIYSFGITLYLLLNDLKFPGSGGYYSKTEIQYNPDFIFPAPKNASREFTHLIRKMCSYDAKERHQSMTEVLKELLSIFQSGDIEVTDELLDLAGETTQTFREDEEFEGDALQGEEKVKKNTSDKPITREEKKLERLFLKKLYREECIVFSILFILVATLMFSAFSIKNVDENIMIYLLFPIAMIFEAVLQKIKAFHILFGISIIAYSVWFMAGNGVSVIFISAIFFILQRRSILSFTTGVSMELCIYLKYVRHLRFIWVLETWKIWWIFVLLILFGISFFKEMEKDFIVSYKAKERLLDFSEDAIEKENNG